ncbi:MAG: anti sigma factor C-terminal domain-containing protein [Cellulosilyticaceae bacterium]
MDKDREIESLFECKEDGLIREAKRRSFIRIVGISIGVSVGVIILGFLLKIQIVPFVLDKQASEKSYHYKIYGANTFVTKFRGERKLTHNKLSATKYKILKDVPVVVGRIEVPGELHENKIYMETGEIYGEVGNKTMRFYHPNIGYEEYSDDLARLEEFDEKDIVEIGLSFDKSYSWEAIKSILPENIDINWCWIDSIQITDVMKEEQVLFEEDNVVGFYAIESNGAAIEKPVEKFMDTLELIRIKTNKYKMSIETILNDLKEKQEIVDEKQDLVIGAVVVGRVSDLKAIQNSEMIKASSFGMILR